MSLDNRLARKIRRKYRIDLLPIGMESYTLGDVVEWDGFIRKPSVESYCFVRYLKIPEENKNGLIKQLKEVKPVAAQLARITLDSSYDFQSGADIPNFMTDFALEIDSHSLTDINVEDIQCKLIERDLKFELMQTIRQQKKDDRHYYRKELKKLFFLDKLFYAGNISLTLKTSSKSQVEAAILKSKVSNPKITEKGEREVSISFPGDLTIPFAADIEQVNDFID